jgi:hypothetical protein
MSAKGQAMQDESQELSIDGTADCGTGHAAVAVQVGAEKLSIVEKVGVSLGHAASDILFQTFILFITIFYTDVFGLSARSVALMFLITKIWDAVNDPVTGMIAGRTETRWGRFRPDARGLSLSSSVVGCLSKGRHYKATNSHYSLFVNSQPCNH